MDVKHSSKYEYLRKWDLSNENVSTAYEENGKLVKKTEMKSDRLELSNQFIPKIQINKSVQTEKKSENEEIKDAIDGIWGDLKVKIIKDLLEHLMGKKIKLLDYNENSISDKKQNGDNDESQENITNNSQDNAADQKQVTVTDQTENPKPTENVSEKLKNIEMARSSSNQGLFRTNNKLQGWGIDYYYKETNYHKEGFEFYAAGNITNDNGQEIAFNTSLQMSREKYEEIQLSLKAGDALIDPLIIDYSAKGVSLSDFKFEFDLNSDGKTELIQAPKAGTGFLAYDKNGNGIIDDGSELFGPSSGNGFSELSDLDEDKNGWIDENDSVFSKLKIWEKTVEGNDVISSLLNKDVGAIYTGRAATVFNLQNQDEISGVIKETGIFLKESGGTGFVQEVDFVV